LGQPAGSYSRWKFNTIDSKTVSKYFNLFHYR
jgi:hypothetical protein